MPLTFTDLLHRVPGVTFNLQAALDGKAKWYCWQGKIGKNPGRYWIPNLFDTSKMPAAVAALQARDGISYWEAAGRVEKSHTGIGNAEIGICPWAYVEMDACDRTEQEARLARLASATALEWALRVFSGGKSVHAYLAYTEPLAPDDPLRLAVQRALIACLEGDTKITDLNRLMRLPGYAGADRPQPVLGLSESRYGAADILDRLTTYAASMGITDIDAAYRALQVAEELEHAANRGQGDSEALRGLAARLRAGRGDAAALLVEADRAPTRARVGTSTGGTRANRSGTGRSVTARCPIAKSAR